MHPLLPEGGGYTVPGVVPMPLFTLLFLGGEETKKSKTHIPKRPGLRVQEKRNLLRKLFRHWGGRGETLESENGKELT